MKERDRNHVTSTRAAIGLVTKENAANHAKGHAHAIAVNERKRETSVKKRNIQFHAPAQKVTAVDRHHSKRSHQRKSATMQADQPKEN